MNDAREGIKDKLLERIRDASNSDEIRWGVLNFREFVTALHTEANTKLTEKEVER